MLTIQVYWKRRPQNVVLISLQSRANATKFPVECRHFLFGFIENSGTEGYDPFTFCELLC